MNQEQWREHQRRDLGITDEQLERVLEVARAATVATGGHVGYDELKTGIMRMSMSASEIATVAEAQRQRRKGMGKTKIQWSDMTWPVVTGCTPCSIGCTNCYAARMAATCLKHHPRYEGLATIENGRARWTGEISLNYDVLKQPLRWRKPRRVFVASMGDLFHGNVPFEFIERVYDIMRQAKRHVFQVLTKRPSIAADFLLNCILPSPRYLNRADVPLIWPNVHLGVSVENQATSDDRREYLRQCPAAIKFVSYEPALAPVDWTGWEFVSQIISGGESGPGARPSHPDWHRATRDFCQANGIAYFFKQWGKWKWYEGPPVTALYTHGTGFYNVGKKAAGHLLDGRTWQQFPQSAGK